VKWLSGLSLCVCVRTCFTGCPKVRPPLPTESTSQIVPTGASAPPSRAHTDAYALAPKSNYSRNQKPLEQSKDQIQNMPKVTPKMTQHKCVHLDHVLQMYHVGYHKGHRPTSIRIPLVEPATSITFQQVAARAGGGSGRGRGRRAGAWAGAACLGRWQQVWARATNGGGGCGRKQGGAAVVHQDVLSNCWTRMLLEYAITSTYTKR